MGKRSTRATVKARVEAVYKMRLGGAEWHDLREFADAPEQAWGVSDGQLRRYIRAADQLMTERIERRADVLLARHLLQRRQLYAHTMQAGDHATALRVLDSEARLERLEPTGKEPSAVAVNVQVNNVSLPAAERAERLRQIYLEATAAQAKAKLPAPPRPPTPEEEERMARLRALVSEARAAGAHGADGPAGADLLPPDAHGQGAATAHGQGV
jgi:hypothetical protein